jgi:glucoamylase
MPLAWAHAEYLKLVRSAADGQVFDIIAEVADRYRNRTRHDSPPLEIWKFNRQVRSIAAGGTLRIQAAAPFRLRWTADGWGRVEDTDSTPIGTGHEFVDVRVPPGQRAPIRFTFFWTSAGRWEGRDFEVGVEREA